MLTPPNGVEKFAGGSIEALGICSRLLGVRGGTDTLGDGWELRSLLEGRVDGWGW